jgi:ABC-type phosphate/phosphonate transport system substrate-binding protein
VPIANARMYSATPAVKAAWKALLAWGLARAGLDWELLDYDAPAPLSGLWARDDLGCAMMCGLPYSQRSPRPTLVAAPVPAPERYLGKPIYFTDIAVRADAPYRRIEDTFGGVVGYTVADSMSGCIALRSFLQDSFSGRAFYREAIGGLVNAQGVIRALDAGTIDVGPLDSYVHDLLRRNDPAFAAKVRVIASTAPAPIPPLVATARLSLFDLQKLRAALNDTEGAPELASIRETLLLRGFAVPDESDYNVFRDRLAASRRFPETWS